MPSGRAISQSLRRSLRAQFSEDADLVFVTISDRAVPPSFEPIRVVMNNVDIIREDGLTYQAMQFDIRLMTDEDSVPRSEIKIPNVDRRIGIAIENLRLAPRIKIELLHSLDFDLSVTPHVPLGSPPPTIEYLADFLFLTNVQVDVLSVSATIVGWDYLQRTWPALRATQNRVPGAFR